MLSLEERINFSLTTKNKEIQKQDCLELSKYLELNKISLRDYCRKNSIYYYTLLKRFDRYGISVHKKINSEPKLNIGICRKASTINAFKELSASYSKKKAGTILSEYVDRCLREGKIL